VSLWAGLDGIEQRLDPGDALNDDLYKRGNPKAAGLRVLPRTLLHALEAFDDDPISKAAFGDYYKDIYLSHKLREWDRTFYRVTDEQRRDQLTFI
jgi:glutamine synthetase